MKRVVASWISLFAVTMLGAMATATAPADAATSRTAPLITWRQAGGGSGDYESASNLLNAINARAESSYAECMSKNCGTCYKIIRSGLQPSPGHPFINGQSSYLYSSSQVSTSAAPACTIGEWTRDPIPPTVTDLGASGSLGFAAVTHCPVGWWSESKSLPPVVLPSASGSVESPAYELSCKIVYPEPTGETCGAGGSTVHGHPIDGMNREKLLVEVDYQGPDGLMAVTRRYSSRREGWDWGYSPVSVADFSGLTSADAAGRMRSATVMLIDKGLYYNGTPAPGLAARTVVLKVLSPDKEQKLAILSTDRGFRVPFTLTPEQQFSTKRKGWVLSAPVTADEPWFAVSPDNTLYLLNRAGVPIREIRHDGRALSYRYEGGMQVVSEPDGRRLSYRTDERGHLGSVLLPDGKEMRYEYDSVGNLIEATYPDGSRKAYHYGEPANIASGASTVSRYWLTGQVDENGDRYATYRYSAQDPVSTELAGGEDRYEFFYGDGFYRVTPPGATQGVLVYWESGQDGERRVTQRQQPAGAGCNASSSAITYDANGNALSRTDFAQNKTCYAYDTARNLETARIEGRKGSEACPTTPASATPAAGQRKVSTQWHPFWRLEVRRAEPKRITTWVYNGQPDPTDNNAVASCAPADAYVIDGVPIAVLCKKVEQATTDADGRDGFEATSEGAARVWRYTYNRHGQMLTARGPRTDLEQTTTYTYYSDTAFDEQGRGHTMGDLQRITNAAGHAWHFDQYDRAGRLLSARDPNGVVTEQSWTARGWLATRSVGGALTRYDYFPTGLLKSVTLPDGKATTYTYDAAHRLTDITDAQGNTTHYTLDAAGNITDTTVFDAQGREAHRRQTTFDALGRPWQQLDARANAWVTEHDALGRPNARIDPKQQRTTYHWDALGRLTRITDPQTPTAGLTTLAYDGRDQLTELTAPNGATTRFTTDGLGNVTREESADRGALSASFDAAGNLTGRTDARGQTETRSWDALDRLLSVTRSDETLRYHWDTLPAHAPAGAPACSHGIGRLCMVEDGAGTTTYAWDARGNLLSETRSEGGQTYTTRYTPDAADRLIATQAPTGLLLEHTLDDAGRLAGLRATLGSTPLEIAMAQDIDAVGHWLATRLGNGRTETRSTDTDGRLLSQALAHSSGSSAGTEGDVPLPPWAWALLAGLIGARLRRSAPATGRRFAACATLALGLALALTTAPGHAEDRYTYDANGNPTDIQSEEGTRTYQYDAIDRLTEETGPQGPRSHRYDKNDNRSTDGATPEATTATYAPASNRLATVNGQSVTLDAAGQLIEEGPWRYTWDAAGRLKTVSHGGTLRATYHYDHRHRRTRKVTTAAAPQGADTVVYHYDAQDRLIAETGLDGRARLTYLWREDRVQAIHYHGPPARIVWLQHDHLGTPRRAYGQDGRLVWRWSSDAYGSTAADPDPEHTGTATPIALRLPGQYHDPESGLHYNWHRYYSPRLARYLSPDPIGVEGGGNLFAYVNANPLSRTDPDGLDWRCTSYGLMVRCINSPPPDPLGPLPPSAPHVPSIPVPEWFPNWMKSKAQCADERADCERRCDREVYDAGKNFCHSMAVMKGRAGSSRYREAYSKCMRQVEQAYVECYQNCGKGE